jgi:hypothetical protein
MPAIKAAPEEGSRAAWRVRVTQFCAAATAPLEYIQKEQHLHSFHGRFAGLADEQEA